MPLLFQQRITRAELRRNPDRLYVFGDNLERIGYGGLARECRGEPNAIGVPTKRASSMDYAAFFTNEDYDVWVKAAQPAWDRIEKAVLEGKTVLFPKAGLGTGLSQLGQRAPRISGANESLIQALQKLDKRLQCEARESPRSGVRRG